jgi:glycosyltransferase involved in cell wall biosynthesis
MSKTAIVIPCYNEAARLDAEEYVSFIKKFSEIDFCFVNDGSKDDTLSVLEKIAARCDGRAQIVDMKKNVGKAEAVRIGMLKMAADGKYGEVGYWDADLATPLGMINKFLAIFRENSAIKLVAGSRIKRLGSKIDRSTKRHYLGRIFATCAGIIIRFPVYDTQCGAKILDAGLTKKVFAEPFVTSWVFDVELFLRVARTLGADAVDACHEVPLESWVAVDGSHFKLRHILHAPVDLLKIILRYGIR